jgi:hypothetical protein
MPKKSIYLCLALCSFLGWTTVFRANAQDTSTPEERTRWVEVARKLETQPFDKDTVKQGEWALKRIIEVHDVHVPLCPSILGGFLGTKYKFKGEITRQLMLASAAYIVEHPDSANDQRALNLSALESVLKTYKSMLASEPKAKSKELSEIAQKQDEGKLAEYVAGTSCSSGSP